MKIEKIRQLSAGELRKETTEAEEQMFRLKLKMRIGQTEGVKKLRELRKDRARMLTVMRERETADGK